MKKVSNFANFARFYKGVLELDGWTDQWMDRSTDDRMDRWMDKASYRDVRMHLKRKSTKDMKFAPPCCTSVMKQRKFCYMIYSTAAVVSCCFYPMNELHRQTILIFNKFIEIQCQYRTSSFHQIKV